MIWAWLFLLVPLLGAWALDTLLAWVYGEADALEEVPS